jgi:hypothetical protein
MMPLGISGGVHVNSMTENIGLVAVVMVGAEAAIIEIRTSTSLTCEY